MDVRHAEEVRDDLLLSMAWFDERREGLGDELEAEFYAAVSVVQDRPHSFAADHTGYRACRLRRFTAVLYYCIESDIIVVMGFPTHEFMHEWCKQGIDDSECNRGRTLFDYICWQIEQPCCKIVLE